MKLRIAIPSRERPQRLGETLASMFKTIEHLDVHNHLIIDVRIDTDDPEEEKYWKVLSRYESYFQRLNGYAGRTGKYIALINELYDTPSIDFDAFLCGTDDIIFEDKGWFEELEKINAKNKYWVAWFNDEEKLEECAQVPILSKTVIDVLGTPLYPKLGHFYGDLWITIVAKLCGIAHYIPTHRIIHMTPKNGRVKSMDKTFMRVRLNEQVLKDMKILEESSADLTDAVNKIQKAMKDDQSN